MQLVNDAVTGILNKRVVLVILDGWGISANWGGNAIAMANPTNFNALWKKYPHAVLQAFNKVSKDEAVGSSEIGHASIGTGRIIRQDLTEINETIKSGMFYKNIILKEAVAHSIKFKSKIHLIGLISDGGVHSHIYHMLALMKLAKIEGAKEVYLHLITDGIDTSDRSAVNYINFLNEQIKKIGIGKIATIVGRHYAMDKSGNDARISIAYLLQTQNIGNKYSDSLVALREYYKQNIFDDKIPATVVSGDKISDYDSVVFFNFRPDRATNLTKAYTDKNYFKSIFGRKYKMFKDLNFTTLTSYMLEDDMKVNVAFPTSKIENNIAGIISKYGLKQLHIAESEKSSHVTYFLNGGFINPYNGEDRIIIKSSDVESYDLDPKMNTPKISEMVCKAIESKKYNFIVANIANVDMVAHTGNIQATSMAVKYADEAIGNIVKSNKNGITIITADHGNAEQILSYNASMKESTHTNNPVPFIYIEKGKERDLTQFALEEHSNRLDYLISDRYTLADIAPTILEIFNIGIPKDMTGQSLLRAINYK